MGVRVPKGLGVQGVTMGCGAPMGAVWGGQKKGWGVRLKVGPEVGWRSLKGWGCGGTHGCCLAGWEGGLKWGLKWGGGP